MTTIERFNLQTGKKESWINRYTSESALDNFIIQTQIAKDNTQSLEDHVMNMIDTELQECLEKALENVLEGLEIS